MKKLLKNVPKIIKCSIISSKNVLKFCPNQRSISDGPKLGRHVGNRANGEVGEIGNKVGKKVGQDKKMLGNLPIHSTTNRSPPTICLSLIC